MYRYLHTLGLVLLTACCFEATAQTLTIRDKVTQLPLEGATLFADTLGANAFAVTDTRGRVDITPFKNRGTITVAHLGHRSVRTTAVALAGGTLLMEQQAFDLNELVISASRFQEKRRDVPERIDVLARRDIGFLDQQTTPDLLQNSGALYVQRSQMGGGSPVIRGFEASRVLLVVDGVRMNNAIYRAGHLQDLMTVDQNAIERIEVINGPGSVVYGSDALGGVVHLITRSPRFADSSGVVVAGGATLRTSTANQEKTASATVELRGRRLASLTSITASDFGDLRMGATRDPFLGDWGLKPFVVHTVNGTDTAVANADANVQDPSGYKQVDVLQKLRFRSGAHTIHQLNAQLSTSTDVPRYDRLGEYSVDSTGAYLPAQAEWYYGPQRRVLLAYTLELERTHCIYSKARITPSYQHIEQSRHNRGFGSSRLNHRTETVNVLGLSADFEKRIGKHELRYGAEYYANTVASEAQREDIHSGAISYLGTRYANGGSTMNTLAAYLSHTFEVNEHFIVSEGLRFSQVELESRFNDEQDFQFLNGTYTQRNSAVNWRLGGVYLPGHDWRFTALASTGFRAPNVDDMGKVFDSTPGTVIVPNTGLKPEATTNFELGLSKTIDGRFTIDVSAFHTLYANALIVGNHTVNGSDSIDYDGTLSKVTALTNAREATIQGAQGQVIVVLDPHFTLRSSLTYTMGRVHATADAPERALDHIPPVYGRTSLEWRAKKVRAECYLVYNGWKRLGDYDLSDGSEDNIQYATVKGTPAWQTVNVRASYAFTPLFSVQAGLENILDTYYRTFASGVSAPGRNFVVSARVQW